MNELFPASEPCRGLAPQTPPELLPLPGERELGHGQRTWVGRSQAGFQEGERPHW